MRSAQLVPHLLEEGLVAVEIAVPDGRALLDVVNKLLHIEHNGGLFWRHLSALKVIE